VRTALGRLLIPLALASAAASGCQGEPTPVASGAGTSPATAPASATKPATAPAATAHTTTIPSTPKEDSMSATAPSAVPASFHALKATTLDGKPADLAAYKGKVLLVVNTASECGLTPQYAGLEKLHEELAGKNFTVLGFPSNDFGGQEPGTPAQIQEFCSSKYGVKFPLFGKVQTKPGDAQSPVYRWLGEKTGSLPRWNFGKYVIGKDGTTVAYFDSKVEPTDPALRAAIDKALAN
jgi:glutathione peroxidase